MCIVRVQNEQNGETSRGQVLFTVFKELKFVLVAGAPLIGMATRLHLQRQITVAPWLEKRLLNYLQQ